jgi:hypothetical protein
MTAADAPAPSNRSRSQLDTALDRVESAAHALVIRERRRRRITTGILAALMLLGALNYQMDKLSSCRGANTSRSEIHQGFQILADTLVPPERATPEQTAEKDAFMASIRSGLPIRGCSFI